MTTGTWSSARHLAARAGEEREPVLVVVEGWAATSSLLIGPVRNMWDGEAWL